MTMRKIINLPEAFVDETLEGIVLAHPDSYRFGSADRRAIVAAGAPRVGQVGIVTGGGSGHLPLFLGYVGEGLATGAAVGNVFSSPSPSQILDATRAANGGNGVLYLYGNYGGDIYNFDLAAEMARNEGISTTTVRGTDDILSASAEEAATRRGIAGLILAIKVAGAAAARGDDLETVARHAQRCVDQMRTVGVGLAPTILPAAGRETFTLEPGMMELGVGLHGEAGVAKLPIETADEIAKRFVAHLSSELDLVDGTRLAILVNGLGATPLEELYVLYRAIHLAVSDRGAVVERAYVGEYATSLEMAGASATALVLDDDMVELLQAPANSPFYKEGSDARASGPGTFGHALGDLETPHGPAFPSRGFKSPLLDAVRKAATHWPDHEEELRELDAALGDGDLGITVRLGSQAVLDQLIDAPDDAAAGSVLREAGLAFASANPSTFAALVGGGLVAASGSFDDSQPLTADGAVAIGRAFADFIARRGGAALGDKTLLDVVVPVLAALEHHPRDTAGAIELAWQQVDATASLRSRRGRAAWHRDRSIGLRDPGSVAIAYLIETLLG